MNKSFLIGILIVFLCSDIVNAQKRKLSGNKIDSLKPKGISFLVDDVPIATSLLQTDSIQHIFETKIRKQILFYPTENKNVNLVACHNNGLIQTIQECYDNHRPLILTPDAIWLTICQGVSIHVNQNFKALEKQLFVKDKPKKIIVRNDSLEYGEKHWKTLIDSIVKETRQYTNTDIYSFFVPQFSTTAGSHTMAYQITLLESYKKAFQYVGESGCGIPSIHIAGETKDWQMMLQQLEMLKQFGLEKWGENLKPIIKEFIKASENNANKPFWKDIYKDASRYNEFYISGWVTKLFPYIKQLDTGGIYDEETGNMTVGEIVLPNPFLEGDNYLRSTLATDNFPSGIAQINVQWNNFFKQYSKNIEVYAGFFGMKQYADKSLEPFISYAICDDTARFIERKLADNYNLDLLHTENYWWPHFAEEIIDSAIYNSKVYQSQSRSMAFIRKLLLDSLNVNGTFNKQEYLQDTLQIDVLLNGTIGEVKLLHSTDPRLANYLSSVLKQLPEPWFPALVEWQSDEMRAARDKKVKPNKIKVRANSRILIGL